MMSLAATLASLGALASACTPAAPGGHATASTEPPSSCVIPPAVVRGDNPAAPRPASVAGGELATCSTAPMTGVYRDGRCATGPDDVGVHVVCARVTDAFLRFTSARGNDLSSPARGFPGLRAGDRWCLCAARWQEAEAAGVAPPVVLEATEAAALRTLSRESLEEHALRVARP